ncbi:MAG: FcoT family thioesterase [Candidatus Pacearchaeota archaeon]|jgi:hypothetical protein
MKKGGISLEGRAGLNEIMNIMLEPYKENCRYLSKVNFNYPSIEGDFHIPSSCYIKDTGHFNAVELIICYNQLAYTFFAHSANQGLIENYGKVPVDEFKKFQLEKTFITKVKKIKFGNQINSNNFYGRLNLKKTMNFHGANFFDTDFNFWDDNGGKADGNILLARIQ